MKGLLFLGIILVVLLVAAIGLSKEKEGFVNPGSNASLRAPEVIVPKVDPAYGPLEGTTPGPYVPPTEKTYGPAFGEQSRVNTLPYKNPELESAKFQRVAELLESLKGFFSFEADSLAKQSDPVVQLPLTTARGDLQRLKDEVDVLKRNPGMDSSLTQAQVDEIQANLAYLQRRFRLSVNSASGLKEGFEPGPDEPQDKGRRLSLEEIQELRTAVSVEIVRLSASGTTDPVTVARVNTLTNIQNALDSLMKEVQTGVRPESEIPIFESDKSTFLPAMSDPSKPLPQLIQENNLPPSVANLFPAYGPGNITGSKVAQTLFAQYGDALFKGLSWDADLRLKYTSQNEVDASTGSSIRKAKEKVGLAHKYSFGVGSKHNNSTENSLEYKRSEDSSDDYSFPRGEMEQYSVDMDSTRVEGKESKETKPPAKFDWKQRTNDICTNIKKTGLKPGDFGCIPTTTKVSLDFSWRGVARMVCSRLLTTPDPGLPEQCGCPPLNWPGWRS
jgi:hypothetical protein